MGDVASAKPHLEQLGKRIVNEKNMSSKFDRSFPLYQEFNPTIPIYCVTPRRGGVIHRFFDTSPFSTSGRYMALFGMPFENRPPHPGEKGEVIIVDLERDTEHIVVETAGWETQMKTNINWGCDDGTVIFNDIDTLILPYEEKK